MFSAWFENYCRWTLTIFNGFFFKNFYVQKFSLLCIISIIMTFESQPSKSLYHIFFKILNIIFFLLLTYVFNVTEENASAK